MTVYTDKKNNTSFVDISSPPVIGRNNKVISLFSGAGGLDIGLEHAGFETVACIELDKDCRETLRFNRPNWNLLENIFDGEIGDVKAISGQAILKATNLKKGGAAIVCGGAPCQPFSDLGKNKGMHDEKNGDLFLEFVRIVSEVLPKSFIFENVTGITQSKHSKVLEYMEQKFTEIGYSVTGKILTACDYGVGQKRNRFFLIGLYSDEQPSFPLPTHSESPSSWAKFTKDIMPIADEPILQWNTLRSVFDTLAEPGAPRKNDIRMNISDVVTERMKHIAPGQNFKALPMNLRPNCWKTGKHAGNDTFGRMQLDKPSPTIRTAAYNPSKGKYIHPTEHRGLSIREAAAIQDFPLHWEFKSYNRSKLTLVSGGKQVGNAVPPSLAEAIGKAIAFKLYP